MKAMVLCAGYGTRLGELTRDWPKPMLPIDPDGRPLLAYVLGHLRAQGFHDIAINVHFRPEILREWFADGSDWGLRLAWSPEEQLLGTAGGVKRIEPYFRDEPAFLVQYGDILTDQDLDALVRHHREHRALATLLVHPRARSNSIITLDPDGSGRITGFLERPSEADRQGLDSPWVNSGICLCSPEILDHIPAGRPADFPRDVFRPLVETGRLHAVPLSGWRCAIDSPERLAETRAAVAEGRCRVQPLTRSNPSGRPVPSGRLAPPSRAESGTLPIAQPPPPPPDPCGRPVQSGRAEPGSSSGTPPPASPAS